MSAIATTRARVRVSDRLLAAVPLASIYLWLSIVYSVEAWKRKTPWLFTDELEFTQLSRSLAETGRAARRGEPHSFRSLYIVVTAPFWRIDDVAAAFSAIKYFDVLVMTSVLFPTYFLARLVVGRAPALFAAAAAAAIPSLAYSSWLVEETLAYPYSTLCLFLIAKAFLVRSPGWIAGAVVASAIAPAVRGELVVIPATLLLTLIFMWWSSARERERRTHWSAGDWLGAFALVAGAIILFSGVMSHYSDQWLKNTAYNWTKHRIFLYGDWAAGSLVVGLGVIPLVLGLAGLVRTRGERWSQELRVFRSVATAALIGFGVYTGMKGAYLSQFFESRVEERNLIYIAPVLFVATAFVLERRRINLWAFAAASAYTLYVALGTPLFVGGGLYSDALGLAIFQQANRYWYLDTTQARWVLVGLFAVAVLTVLVFLRGSARAGVVVGTVVAVGVLAWNITGEIAAAAGSVTVARDVTPALSEPFTWVDDGTHLKPTIYLGQAVADQNPVWLLEFWNRSIKAVSSLDGSIKGPGPAGAPNITRSGQLYWTGDPASPGKVFDYAVEDWPCIDFAGTHVATHRYHGGATALRQWRLLQLTKPNRLRAMCVGIYPDGWTGASDSRYFRFVSRKPGWLRITLSRSGFRGSPVDIQLGTIVGRNHQPEFGRTLRHVATTVATGRTVVEWIPTPAAPFAVRTVVRDKFVPHELDPSSGDTRTLGALISYQWFSTKR
jgi:hypothetical protein